MIVDMRRTRRMAIDNGIPLITDIQCAKLYVAALKMHGGPIARPLVRTDVDCISSARLLRLPGGLCSTSCILWSTCCLL